MNLGNPLMLTDFYKTGHKPMYPTDLEFLTSNHTCRGTRLPNCDATVFVGLQYLLKEYYLGLFKTEFFDKPLSGLVAEYKEMMASCLGITDFNTEHIEALHKYGRMPIDIWAVPEGAQVGIGCPSYVIRNSVKGFGWLVNYLESLNSNIIWGPITSATKALRMRKIMEKWAKRAGETDLGFVNWQGHDFSFRGMMGVEGGALSGLGHLTSFSGTDTIPAIQLARKYYGANWSAGGSVPATEHSVMCAYLKEAEFETFRHLIEDVHPTGILSIVSDTWNLWTVLTEFVPKLKDTILARKGKIVFRPDSGDPVDIVCGDKNAPQGSPEGKGVLRLLAEALGVSEGSGYLPLINNAGCIYGDSIDEDRCEAILRRTVEELGYSPYNNVFGIGSYSYQYVTRDTHSQAIKATECVRSGESFDMEKDPVTGSSKKSAKGIPCVYQSTFGKKYNIMTDGNKLETLDKCGFVKVFEDGYLKVEYTLDDIRKRVADSE